MCNEVTIILTVFAWGLLSDHSAVGRRPIYCLGFVLMGLSIFAHPIVGVAPFNNVVVLMAVRVLFALGMRIDRVSLRCSQPQVLVPLSR